MYGLGKTAYGIDISGNRVFLVRATLSGGTARYSRAEAGDAAVRDATGPRGMAAAALNGRECFARWLDLPAVSSKNVLKVLPTVLDLQVPFPIEDCVYTFPVVDEVTHGKSRAMAVAIRKSDIETGIKRYKDSGFDPAILDHEGLALWTQSLLELPASANTIRLVVYIGLDRWVAVIGAGPVYFSSHYAKPGDGASFHRIVLSGLDAVRAGRPDVSAASTKVMWCLCGQGASDQSSVESILSLFSSDCRSGVKIHSEPELFLARSVARRALVNDGLSCNMRIGAYEHTAMVSRKEGRVLRSAIAMALSGILLIGVSVAVLSGMKSQLNTLDSRFREKVSEVAGSKLKGQKGAQAIAIAQRVLSVREYEQRHFVSESLMAQCANELMAACVSGKTIIDSLSLSDEQSVLNGVVASKEGIDVLDSILQKYGYLTKANIHSRQAETGLLFTIIGQKAVRDE